jgi:hypothetical protein
MNPLVRDLYKRFVYVGKIYPKGADFVRTRAKEKFFENAGITEEVELKKAIATGRYWVRELSAISKLHKYRTMAKRYYP